MSREFYALGKYALTNTKDQFYIRNGRGDNVYLNINGQDILARKGNGNIHYAKNVKGDFILPLYNGKPYYGFGNNGPIFPINNEDKPVYGKNKNSEIYPNDGVSDLYLTDSEGNQCYAKNSKGQFFYGSKLENGQLVQYYAKNNKDQDIILTNDDGEISYLINLTTNKPVYALKNQKEIYQVLNDKQIYGRNRFMLPVYARDEQGNEYFALDKDLQPYYSFYKDLEFYPKMKNKKQFYLKMGTKEIYANESKSKQYFAKNEHSDDILACSNTDTLDTYYCENNQSEEYPKTASKDQYYRFKDKKEVPAVNENFLPFYAKGSNGISIYPIRIASDNEDSEEE